MVNRIVALFIILSLVVCAFAIAENGNPVKGSRQRVLYVEIPPVVVNGVLGSTKHASNFPEAVEGVISNWLDENPTKEICSFDVDFRRSPSGVREYFGVWIVYKTK